MSEVLRIALGVTLGLMFAALLFTLVFWFLEWLRYPANRPLLELWIRRGAAALAAVFIVSAVGWASVVQYRRWQQQRDFTQQKYNQEQRVENAKSWCGINKSGLIREFTKPVESKNDSTGLLTDPDWSHSASEDWSPWTLANALEAFDRGNLGDRGRIGMCRNLGAISSQEVARILVEKNDRQTAFDAPLKAKCLSEVSPNMMECRKFQQDIMEKILNRVVK